MNSLPYLIHRDCDLNLGPSASESSTLTARLPSMYVYAYVCVRAEAFFKQFGIDF